MPSKRVLLVATSEDVRVLAGRLLERSGVTVDSAETPAEAVLLLVATAYHVVAVDRTTGGGDEELLRHLAGMPAPRPVVIVTSPNKLNDRLDPAMVDLVVSEPVDAHTFVGVVLACVAEPPLEHHLPTTHSPLPFDSAE